MTVQQNEVPTSARPTSITQQQALSIAMRGTDQYHTAKECASSTSEEWINSTRISTTNTHHSRKDDQQQAHSPLEETAEPTERDDRETEDEKPTRRRDDRNSEREVKKECAQRR
jgi:hypothetical protein